MNSLNDNPYKTGKEQGLQRTETSLPPNYYGHTKHRVLLDIAHRSQKIATAVYLLTDLLSPDDPLVRTMKSVAIEATRTLYRASQEMSYRFTERLSVASGLVYEIRSYLEILKQSGRISSMNHKILNHECTQLQSGIDELISNALPYDRNQSTVRSVQEFSLSDDFFETPRELLKDEATRETTLKDTSPKTAPSSKTAQNPQQESVSNINKMSHRSSSKKIPREPSDSDSKSFRYERNNKEDHNEVTTQRPSQGHQPSIKRTSSKSSSPSNSTSRSRKERHENIIKILKQKRVAKISDLSAIITDCSSKTLQRDLNALVKKGIVLKEGERRWSTYQLKTS